MHVSKYNYLCLFIYFRELNSSVSAKDLPMVHPEVVETYIELMCQNDLNHVHNFLRQADGYRLEETLEVSFACFC